MDFFRPGDAMDGKVAIQLHINMPVLNNLKQEDLKH
jgi:hypothetical protein